MLLDSAGTLTGLVRDRGIETMNELFSYVRRIPYGRNSSRATFSQVITENRGTCSSKHAFVKAVAAENGIGEVRLILCLYKMTEINTPGIGDVLSKNGIDHIPEAHCYLRFDNSTIDLTTETSNLAAIESDILEETEILPTQVTSYKVDYHQSYIRKWISGNNMKYTFEEIWQIREACIHNLSKPE